MVVPNIIEQFTSANFTNYLVTLIIPFLIIFGVLLFSLRRTRVLGHSSWIYVIISLGLTVMIYQVNPGGVFQFLASYLFKIGVAGTIIALMGAIVFIFFGLINWTKDVAEKLKSDQEKLKSLEKRENKLMKKYYDRGIFSASTGERMKIQQEIDDITRQKKYLMAKLRR